MQTGVRQVMKNEKVAANEIQKNKSNQDGD